MKFLRNLFGLCSHDYEYHKIRHVEYDSLNPKNTMDYSVEFYQCQKCGHIKFIHMSDNLRHSTCN